MIRYNGPKALARRRDTALLERSRRRLRDVAELEIDATGADSPVAAKNADLPIAQDLNSCPAADVEDEVMAIDPADDSLLEREEEIVFVKRWQDDQDYAARNRLVMAHQRMVSALARKFTASGLPHRDLINEGNIGLMTAIDRFDVEKGNRLSTYAKWWCFTMMQSYAFDNVAIVRLGRSRPEINAARRIQAGGTGEDTGLDPRRLDRVRGALNPRTLSLNASIGEEGDEFVDCLADEAASLDRMMAGCLSSSRKGALERLFGAISLTERERVILKKRLLSEEATTLKEIADLLSVSAERVRQIEQSLLRKLRRAASQAGLRAEDFIGEIVA